MGRFNDDTPSKSRRSRNDSLLEILNTSPPFGAPSIVRCIQYRQKGRRHASPRRRHQHRHQTQAGFVAPDDYVSDRADRTRRLCFYFLALLSILPFVGVLVLAGAFTEALKWATQGEVDRLTTRQRRFIKLMLLAECIIYTGGVVAIVVYFVMKNKTET